MQDITAYYKRNFENYKAQVSKIYKRLTSLSLARVVVFVAMIIALYFFYKQWQIALGVVLLGVVLFLLLLSKHGAVSARYELKKALVAINKEELNILTGTYLHKKDGAQFQDAKHNYALDIDLFGHGSFFQCIDRTATNAGALTLANLLKENNILNIENRQEAIKELSEKIEWRQLFQAYANLIKVDSQPDQILEWLHNYKPFLPKALQVLPLVFSIISMLLLGLGSLKIIPIALFGYWLLIGLAITGAYFKKVTYLASHTDKMRDTFRQYA